MSQTITVTTVAMSPAELRAMFIEAVQSMGPSALPVEVVELEHLKRKALLTPDEVEKLYGLNARTLCNKRGQGRGPEYIQEAATGPVFYEHKAIQAYLDLCRKRSHA